MTGRITSKVGRHPWLLLALASAFFIVSSGALFLLWLSRGLPSLETLERYTPTLSSRVYDIHDNLIGEFYQERRSHVDLEKVPPELVQALIATEDRRFREHWGIDLNRIVGAIWVDLTHLSYKQGASTITQQLARNLYLNQDKNVVRKLREILTAIQIERAYSKDEILEMYLTQTYFGHGAYGVQRAALRYFDKDIEDCDLAECALLVGLLKAPGNYSPFFEPEAGLRRRNLVLQLMAGQDLITPDQLKQASASPLTEVSYVNNDTGLKAPYFSERVRNELEPLLHRMDLDLYRDGLNIHTTLDLRLQELAEKALEPWLARQDTLARAAFLKTEWADHLRRETPGISDSRIAALRQDKAYVQEVLNSTINVQAAFVALDPHSGAIRAMVGGRDFSKSEYNRATQARRQPGSAFKPILYIAALEQGYAPSTRLLNQDVVVEESDGTQWTPQNYDDSRGGLTTLREGLRMSYNLVAVRLLMDLVPPRRVAETASRIGISAPLELNYTLALGSSGISPLELTSAYACMANQGIWCRPFDVESVTDSKGKLVYRNRPLSKDALSPGVAYLITDMLKTTIDHGTGGPARWRYGFTLPAGGKTGTTNAYTDAWFVGYTPQLAAAVWVGNDDPRYALGKGQSGGAAALPPWAMVMAAAQEQGLITAENFQRPESVVDVYVCSETMERAGALCPSPVSELFLRDFEPRENCHLHKLDY
ncbi:MAG: PBP1A family penicillin-binding protein [Calditrichaeota bacterium]|nr:PBP1A family penicillin-binding protein [Calditrichota bacterium]